MGNKKILVIDDDANLSKLLKVSLEEAGPYEVEYEIRAEQAVSKIMDFKPDLIFLDVVLGDIDGGEIASRIKDNSGTKDIPIVFLTGVVTEEEVQGGAIGGYPFLAKPVSTDKLIKKIESLLTD